MLKSATAAFSRSMSDRMFFSLIALLAVGMVVVAINPFADRKPSGPVSSAGRNALDLVIKGDELYRFVAGNVGALTLVEPGEGRPETLLHVYLERREAYDTPLYGPHLVLDADLERNYEGRRIRVTVTARPAPDWSASEMEVNYSTGRSGESGWERFALSPEFRDYSFEYDVPHADSEMGYDYLAIRPVAPDKQRAVAVAAIRIEGLGAKRSRE